MSRPFKIGTLALELKEDGTVMYWLYGVGTVAGQGGLSFGHMNSGYYSLEDLQKGINRWLERDQNMLIDIAKKKMENGEGDE